MDANMNLQCSYQRLRQKAVALEIVVNGNHGSRYECLKTTPVPPLHCGVKPLPQRSH